MTYFSFRNTHLTNQEGSGEEGGLTAKEFSDLKEGLGNLPYAHAQIMILRYFEDVPMDEIAKRLGLEPSVVHQMHFDALTRLRQKE